MRYLPSILFTSFLAVGLFATTAPSASDASDRLTFNSVSKTEDRGTSILVIPMKGQMSTDISIEAYEPLFTRIKDLDPDLIVFEMFCQDYRDEFYAIQQRGDSGERSGYNPDSVKDLVRFFRIELEDIDQIMWIQDSCGGSSVLTFAWPDIYMSDKAKLQGTYNLEGRWKSLSPTNPVRHKYYQAATAHVKTVAEIGGRSIDFIMTFVDPDLTVSGTYEGRDVVWKEGLDGYLVFDVGPSVPNINAWDAEQFAISKATVRDLDDILLTRGIREYHLVGEDISNSIEEYKVSWRKTFEKAVDLWDDSLQFAKWATGEETERFLREQLKSVEQVLRLLKKSDAVGFRMMGEYRISKDGKYGTYDLRQLIKQLQERLRALRDAEDAEDSGGRRGGGGLAGSSGGGGAR